MASRTNAGLAAVRLVEPPARPIGDTNLTREAAASWTEGERRCRARGRHMWQPFTVWEHSTFYDVVERCPSCKNRRSADFNKSGRRTTRWQPDYRSGNYLLPRGAARIRDDEELMDQLTLADILSRKIVEVTDDDDEGKV